MAPQLIDVSRINVSRKKLRKLSQAKINRYANDYERGDEFPPIVVEDCGGFISCATVVIATKPNLLSATAAFG